MFIKRWSILLLVEKTQLKTRMGCHYTYVRLVKIGKFDSYVFGNISPLYILLEVFCNFSVTLTPCLPHYSATWAGHIS